MRAVRILLGVLRGVLIAAVGLLLVYNIYVLIARHVFHNDMPLFCGLGFAVVATGSMEPTVCAGDVIVVAERAEYAVGDIVTYRAEGFGGTVTHRIVREEDGAFITKGDREGQAEDDPVLPDQIVGKVVAVWSGFGAVIGFFQSPLGLLVLLGGGAVVWVAADLIARLFKKENEDEAKEQRTTGEGD